jgi:hypothetical protein
MKLGGYRLSLASGSVSFANEAGIKIEISFNDKIKKGSREKRISLEPWYWHFLVTPFHHLLQNASGL